MCLFISYFSFFSVSDFQFVFYPTCALRSVPTMSSLCPSSHPGFLRRLANRPRRRATFVQNRDVPCSTHRTDHPLEFCAHGVVPVDYFRPIRIRFVRVFPHSPFAFFRVSTMTSLSPSSLLRLETPTAGIYVRSRYVSVKCCSSDT
jgi:hypothetical protein